MMQTCEKKRYKNAVFYYKSAVKNFPLPISLSLIRAQ